MAKISFSLEELVGVLISNKVFPPEIVRVSVRGGKIHFVIRTNLFILPFVPASLRFLSFNDSLAVFELTIVSSHLTKSLDRFRQMLKLKIPAYMKLDYPRLLVDVDMLLKEKNIKGVRVKDVLFEGGEFTIVTCSS
jgi:hypothetical protein